MTLIGRLTHHAEACPERTALCWPGGDFSYSALLTEIDLATELLRASGVKVLALDLENGPAWIALDIAALQLGICLVPLPPFFSGGQQRHILQRTGVQAVVTDDPDRLFQRAGVLPYGDRKPINLTRQRLYWVTVDRRRVMTAVPAGIHKVTFTSGTTGEPKGVMLSWQQMQPVVESLVEAAGLRADDRHLALLPLAVLLENIGGVYAPLWAGASVALLAAEQVGMTGSSEVDAATMCQALSAGRATTAIFTPQTLLGLVQLLERDPRHPPSLRYAAVGGAPVSPRLLQRAAAVGLPVYEGYGLSECASVVCLNTLAHCRPGSVGRALPHVRLSISEEGEVLVGGVPFSGYLGEPSSGSSGCWRTGDLGELDADGFLYLHGRRRNTLISAFGRNIAPEWVERELMLEPEIVQAAVFGEARPFIVAIVVSGAGVTPTEIDTALARCNRTLPDYARVFRWIRADAPFSNVNGMLTGTGRIRRAAIFQHYRQPIESLYNEVQSW
ncbi:MAG: AMP-binding protein [Chromatiaceae bacterium]|nr:AMP-binding protein [Chromatiaceae bacterium]